MGSGGTKKIIVGCAAVVAACIIIAVVVLRKEARPSKASKAAEMTLLRNEAVDELKSIWNDATFEYMENPAKGGTLLIQIPKRYTVIVPTGKGQYEGSATNWARVDSSMPITVTLMQGSEVCGDFVWEPQANRVDTLAIR